MLSLPTVAGPFDPEDFENLVPVDKKLDPAWVESLTARGTRHAYRGGELEHIGMPIGGVCAGQLYLSGDGRLWLWDIFNENRHTSGAGVHYRQPLSTTAPVEQGFALSVVTEDGVVQRRLDRRGFSDVTFYGEYPMGMVRFRDASLPVDVSLEAFSPFIPVNTEESSLPATIMRYTVTNNGPRPAEIALSGWLENAVCLRSGVAAPVVRRNRTVALAGIQLLDCSAEEWPQAARAVPRADIVYADFEATTYEGWRTTGEAFGSGPSAVAEIPAYQGDVQAHGQRTVNSHAAAPGDSVSSKDAATGTLTSPDFVVDRDFINFRMGGGAHRERTCMNLLVDDRVVLSATGQNDNRMTPRTWDVRRWAGRTAQLQVVDNERGGWGNIGVDQIIFSDRPQVLPPPLAQQPDYGTMGLVLFDSPLPKSRTEGAATVAADELPAAAFLSTDDREIAEATGEAHRPLIGALQRGCTLAPGESTVVTFAVVWCFPNAQLNEFSTPVGRYYATRFANAQDVAVFLAEHLDRLYEQTRLWHDTWYDSTLPFWFLDRTFVNTSILATTTCYRFRNGRFYGWEGVGCCAGTCLHVWQYAQAVGRVFPELERITRERVDFGVSFQPATGVIGYRGPEVAMHAAADGQAGTILRAYREHQMSPDDQFLRRTWPRIKRSIEWLMELDSDRDGVLDQPQYNTLDDAWYGEVAWISSLYVAALRAGEAMAREMDDRPFQERVSQLAARGRDAIGERLFNGEFFIHRGDPDRPQSPGSYGGCEIDQVFGQSYAFQVGLGRVLDPQKVRTALQSLWRYNYTPDVGPYRTAFPKGRWYALAGEGGLLMCTFPKGDADALEKGNPGFAAYFNECMTGFEYQVAGHMLWERMVTEGLAITRTIHDRYHPLRRNPFNEIECGDHYARAMASFGVYLAACGYRYHGPRGFLAFAPRITPEDFRCAFTVAEGWGTFTQQIQGKRQNATLGLRYGTLRLEEFSLELGHGIAPTNVEVNPDFHDESMAMEWHVEDGQLKIRFAAPVQVTAGQTIKMVIE